MTTLTQLTDHQKAGLESVRQYAAQIMTVGAGFLAFVGGFLVKMGHALHHTDYLWFTLWALVLSVLCGLLVYGAIIDQLSKNRFDAWSAQLRWAGFLQLVLLFAACVAFVNFVMSNL